MPNTDILEEIKDKLVALESKAATAKESKNNGGLWGWIVALIMGAAVSIGAALLIWKLNKKNEELAKLHTQIEQDKIRDAQLQHKIAVAGHQERIDVLASEAAEVFTRITRNRNQLREEAARHAESLARIKAARDWNQLDVLNRENR